MGHIGADMGANIGAKWCDYWCVIGALLVRYWCVIGCFVPGNGNAELVLKVWQFSPVSS